MPATHDTVAADRQVDIEQILARLNARPESTPLEDLEYLHRSLGELLRCRPAGTQLRLLPPLQEFAAATVERLLPRLFHVRLPISATTRRNVRAMQDVLEWLAGLEGAAASTAHDDTNLPETGDTAADRIVGLLYRHIFISDLTSASPSPGIWQQLHKAALQARQPRPSGRGNGDSPRATSDRYARALLMGCTKASFFTAHEWRCIEHYLCCHGELVQVSDAPPVGDSLSVFWVDPAQDMAPVALARRPAPDGVRCVYLACDRLVTALARHLEHLRNGAAPDNLGFPDDLAPRLARTLLRRLVAVWSGPRKRRFPRRRQGYRANMYLGFEHVCALLQGRLAEAISSEWLVTNESPDGYATMHVAGKTPKVQIGDLAAMQSNDARDWQICIVRWAQSENAEHLELGLQVLAPRAIPAMLALPGHASSAQHPVLLMPAVPPLRESQALATLPGLLLEQAGKFVLLVESGKVEVREVRVSGIQEQSASIDVFAIEPDPSP